MQTTARWWRDVGITDADGHVHKIDAFVAIESVDDLLMATYLCGSGGCGLALPASAENQFEAGQVWDDLKSEPTGGHYVPCVGFMGGHLVVVTWGELQGMTRAYCQERMEDGVCCLSREYMLASGLSPELINWSALMNDVQALASPRQRIAASVKEQVAEHVEKRQEDDRDSHAKDEVPHKTHDVKRKPHRRKSELATEHKPRQSHRQHSSKK